jgi:hypothetical protein
MIPRAMRESRRAIVRELLAGALFVALAVLWTWPLVLRLRTATSDLGDPLLNVWILDWVCHALVHDPLSLFQAPIFHPARFPLAFSENMIGIAAAMLPLHLAGLHPMTVYNLAVLLGFAFSGYGAWVLGRTLTASSPHRDLAGLVAGILYAFVPFRFDHLPQVQIIWSGWLPLIVTALVAWWRRPSPRRAALAGVCLVMNGLGNIHWLLFGTTAGALAMLVLFILDRSKTRKEWAGLLVAFVVAGLAMLPVLWPYRVVSKLYSMRRGPGEVMLSSADPHDWLIATTRSRLYGPFVDPDLAHAERALFPGMMLIFLTIAALALQPPRDDVAPPDAAAPSRRTLLMLDAAAAVLAVVSWFGAVTSRVVLGDESHRILSMDSADVPFTLLVLVLFARFTLAIPRAWGGGTLRTRLRASRFPPEVWICVMFVVVGVLGSFGLKGFFHHFLYRRVVAFQSIRTPARWAIVTYTGLAGTAAWGTTLLMMRRRRLLIALSIVALCVIDVLPSLRWQHAESTLPAVYAAIPRGPILELPIEAGIEYRYLGYAAQHHLLSMNGISGFEPPLHHTIREKWLLDTIPESMLDDLAAAGCRYVVVHEDWLHDPAASTHDFLRRALAAHRLSFAGRFDHGVGGDWLFKLAPGLTSDPALDNMLAGQPTANTSTFGLLESPHDNEDVHGSLTISGFALSPDSVAEVDILFDDGRIRMPAEFTPRPDVDAHYPGYPRAHASGFTLTLPSRPPNVRRATDLQVEIIDGRNHRTRLPDIFVQW